MKKMKLVWMVLNFCSAVTASARCPDFTGTYVGDYGLTDWRNQQTFILKQTGCEKIAVVSIMSFKSYPKELRQNNSTWTISQTSGDKVHWYWNSQQQLESLQKKANTEGCDIRDIMYLDPDKNLNERWRFECPKGNSPWYTSNIVEDIYYLQDS